jgi:hypothetical protein
MTKLPSYAFKPNSTDLNLQQHNRALSAICNTRHGIHSTCS